MNRQIGILRKTLVRTGASSDLLHQHKQYCVEYDPQLIMYLLTAELWLLLQFRTYYLLGSASTKNETIRRRPRSAMQVAILTFSFPNFRRLSHSAVAINSITRQRMP